MRTSARRKFTRTSRATGCGKSTGSFIPGRDSEGRVPRVPGLFPLFLIWDSWNSPLRKKSLKIVNDDFFHQRFHAMFDEFKVLRMRLVFGLGRFALKNQVQRHLITLIHNGPQARRQSADMILLDAGNRPEVFFWARP